LSILLEQWAGRCDSNGRYLSELDWLFEKGGMLIAQPDWLPMLEDAAADVVLRRKFSYLLHGYRGPELLT
jgi:hypothetical protein